MSDLPTIELFPGVLFRRNPDRPVGWQWEFEADGQWLIARHSYCDDTLLDHVAELVREVERFKFEGRTITLSGCEFTEHELLGRAVRAVQGSRRNTMPRWGLVRDAFGTGSGVATALCRRFNFDPDEVLKN